MNLLFEQLEKDLVNIFKNELINQNVLLPAKEEDIPIVYFNLKRRLISSHPRKIEKAKDFCCPSRLQNDLTILERKIERGEDLTPYLSRQLHKTSQKGATYDDLLNDWNIHHLHFKTTGTNELLFVWVEEDVIYEIGIYDHDSWTDKDILEKVLLNWENLLITHKMLGTPAFITDEKLSIGEMRKNNINIPIKLSDGNCYSNIGGGITSAGTSVKAQMNYTKFNNELFKKLKMMPLNKGQKISIEKIKSKINVSINNKIVLSCDIF